MFEFGEESGKSRIIAGEFFAKGTKAPYAYFRPVRVNGRDEYGRIIGGTLANGVITGGTFVPANVTISSVASSAGLAVPYLKTFSGSASPSDNPAQREWREMGKYQIVCAGLDDLFGTVDANGTIPQQLFRLTPGMIQDPDWATSGIWFSDGDFDNITSFASGRLEDEG